MRTGSRSLVARIGAARHSWPGWLNESVDQLLRFAPAAILRWLDRRLLAGTEAPPLPAVQPAAIRLYIAPANFAGQGFEWARAVERGVAGATAVNMAFSSSADFAYPADQSVSEVVYRSSRFWQRRQWRAVRDAFTHVLIEAERPLFGRYFEGGVAGEVGALLSRGIDVAFLCHGTDVRLPSRHAGWEPDSPFRPGLWERTDDLERRARTNLELLARSGRRVFVSTPDLLLDIPSAEWLPVVVQPDRWQTKTPPMRSAVPIVVHAPSKAIVKGSDLIDPVLTRLDADGVIRYRRVQGVPAADMPEIYRESDIVLDQFRIGNYGVAACEALAAGRVVVSHVSTQVRDAVLTYSGRTLPIIESRAADLEMTLRRIIDRPEEAKAAATSGPDFVRGLHDGGRSAAVLEGWLSGGFPTAS
ncbi:hypothetical protein [Agromyces neolithicus]|uniref:Glycosyltransferase family 1 protein n=1 Tax=Agromyces neolithicus TaxID=269420 RepID=A0ABN2M0M1_9MICO